MEDHSSATDHVAPGLGGDGHVAYLLFVCRLVLAHSVSTVADEGMARLSWSSGRLPRRHPAPIAVVGRAGPATPAPDDIQHGPHHNVSRHSQIGHHCLLRFDDNPFQYFDRLLS